MEPRVIELLCTFSGDTVLDVVTVRQNGALITRAQRQDVASGHSLSIRYESAVDTRLEIRAIFSFIGHTLTDLMLSCYIDGVARGEATRCPMAAHRWEVSATFEGEPLDARRRPTAPRLLATRPR